MMNGHKNLLTGEKKKHKIRTLINDTRGQQKDGKEDKIEKRREVRLLTDQMKGVGKILR